MAGQRSDDFQSGATARWIHLRPWVRRVIVGVLIGVMATLQITSMREEVQTVDEGVHLASGVSYWVTRDFRLNEEHPPLIKLLAAVPVLLARPTIPLDAPSWQEGNQWAFARDFLYHSGNNADQLLFLGRLAMVALGAGLGLMLYLWGRKLAGDVGGLFTLGWYALDPNFLAHGRYITTDVGVTLGYAATLYLLVRLFENWTRKRLLIFALVFGLAQMAKFSAAFLLIIAVCATFIFFVRQSRNFRVGLRKSATILLVSIVGTIVTAMVCYFGQVRTGNDDPWVAALLAERERVVTQDRIEQQPSAVQRVIRLTDPTTRLGRTVQTLVLHTPVPAWSYLKGFALVVNHEYWGHLAYLNGMYSNFGWWWYFPFALFVKLPAATLVMSLLAFAGFLYARLVKQQKFATGYSLIMGAAIAYLFWSMSSSLNLGIRHIFPVYAAFFVGIGTFLTNAFSHTKRFLRIVLGGIVLIYILTSALAYPAYTSYFSEFAGGSSQGSRYLVDSNIDWGQDLKRLAHYLRERNIPFVCMSYFGQADLTYYGIDYRYLPTAADPHSPADVNCVVAISITSQLSQDGAYWWLNAYEPDARIGGSINVFDFRDGRAPRPAH